MVQKNADLLKCFAWCAAVLLLVPTGAVPGAALDEERNRMVDEEIVEAGVTNPRVIAAMRKVPRHEFVPFAQRKYAYFDMALPIGHQQTISPPFVVAFMTEKLDPRPNDRVLEIGTGSGYQAAVLSHLVRDVYTIEIVEPLGRKAAKVFEKLKYKNVHAKIGDGFKGWARHAPYDKIIVTCSPERVPIALAQQLREGGRMVIPVGERYQQMLYLLTKKDGKLEAEKLEPTFFVPMTGTAEAYRRIQPDPAHPRLVNGDFETLIEETEKPAGWHYQRQLKLVADALDCPSGKHYVMFTNAQPGRSAQALQGFAVDGREVKNLDVSLQVKGSNVRPGGVGEPLPGLIVIFFDQNRNYLSLVRLGTWRGTFDWRYEHGQIEVPVRAREAIVRIGLQGALGRISFDTVAIKPAK